MKRVTCGVVVLFALGLLLVLGPVWLGWLSGAVVHPEVVLAILGDLSPIGAVPSRREVTDFHCSSSAPLTSRVQPGALLQRHRHSLELMTHYDSSPYVIVNPRTEAVYRWGYEGPNAIAKAAFGVPTAFALLHPDWEHDPWVLLYNCA